MRLARRRARRRSTTARISPFDHGLLVGDGVFETLRVYDGVPFAWTRHYERLGRSAGRARARRARRRERCARRPTPCSRERPHRGAAAHHRHRAGRRRSGSERGDGRPTVIVVATRDDAVAADGRRRDRPVDAQRARRRRRPQDDLVRRERARARVRARARRGEAIFANTARRPVRGDRVERVPRPRRRRCAPRPPTAGCLLGVTRALVLELCAARRHAAPRRRARARRRLADADEAFLTSSTREVQPIARVDGRRAARRARARHERRSPRLRRAARRDLDP